MKVVLTVKTTDKGFETANYLLRIVCEQLTENPEMRKKLSLTKADINSVAGFRKAIVEAATNNKEV